MLAIRTTGLALFAALAAFALTGCPSKKTDAAAEPTPAAEPPAPPPAANAPAEPKKDEPKKEEKKKDEGGGW